MAHASPPAGASPASSLSPQVITPPSDARHDAGPSELAPGPAASSSKPSSTTSTSSPPEPDIPRPPDISHLNEDENAAIDATLSQRQKHRKRPRLLRSHSSSGSEAFDPVELQHRLREEAEACELAGRHIDLEVDGRILHSEAQLPPMPKVTKAHYAWEVMYENQRGFSIFGKAWYSANGLLPTDPTPFTLPLESPDGDFTLGRSGAKGNSRNHEREGSSSSAGAEADPGPSNGREASASNGRGGSGGTGDTERSASSTHPGSKGTATRANGRIKRRSIKTGYSLKTYETPSPAWAWLTPWMVNMRLDTDHQGWRYNLWFHTRGWASHPGRLNWWGWVRRREWVRLRALLPPEEGDDGNEQEKQAPVPKTLDEVLGVQRPVANMMRFLAVYALDREKLAVWEGWMKKGTAGARHQLADLFEDREKLTFISRAFIYPTARKAFFSGLVAHGIIENKECMECSDIEFDGAE